VRHVGRRSACGLPAIFRVEQQLEPGNQRNAEPRDPEGAHVGSVELGERLCDRCDHEGRAEDAVLHHQQGRRPRGLVLRVEEEHERNDSDAERKDERPRTMAQAAACTKELDDADCGNQETLPDVLERLGRVVPRGGVTMDEAIDEQLDPDRDGGETEEVRDQRALTRSSSWSSCTSVTATTTPPRIQCTCSDVSPMAASDYRAASLSSMSSSMLLSRVCFTIVVSAMSFRRWSRRFGSALCDMTTAPAW
jgi:hypothetical protein